MELTYQICNAIAEIKPEEWVQCCRHDYPFTRYAFLHALEASGAVSAETGWQPVHLKIMQGPEIIALLPMYLKSHSYGEYVFDWAWADAYHRHQRPYYPKLLTAIPFSPVSGPRLLTQLEPSQLTPLLTKIIPDIAGRLGAHSWHGLFWETSLKPSLAEHFMIRDGCQYHWFNRGYSDFEHYLSHFNSRKRKTLRKEREKVRLKGIELRRLAGNQITPENIEIFYRFYQATYWKRGQRPYLPLSFFKSLLSNMPEQLLLIEARLDNSPVAAALCFEDSTTLYGRYWGCLDEYDSLHFETCYYQGIEYCIEKGLQRFDPGAQGEHKIQRGFEPIQTYSTHWVEEQGFNQAIGAYLEEERELLAEERERLKARLPFKNTDLPVE